MTVGPQPPRVLFYVQHLLGIGHLMRAGRITEALARHGFEVTMVTGGLPVEGFRPAGVQMRALPPMAVDIGNFGALVDGDGQPVDEHYQQGRREALLQIYRECQPDCVVLEAFPFGRRQVRFELLPLIETIEATRPKPLLLSSIRDILQRRSKPGRNEETARLINQHFDKVLVHGDPGFASLEDSFACTQAIAERIVYTGLVCAARAPVSAVHFDVVVSAGGGAVGNRLAEAAIEAAQRLPAELTWCIISGPNLPAEQYLALSQGLPDNVLLERFRPDFRSLLGNAGVSVSQAGYNTMGDILQSGCRAILVPYSEGGETEQADRAERLQRIGRVKVIDEPQLDGETLAALVSQVMADDDEAVLPMLDTRGAERTAEILQALIPTSQNRDIRG